MTQPTRRGSARRHDAPLEVRHSLDLPLAPLAQPILTLGDLMAGVSAALTAGVPLDAIADVEPARRERTVGRRLQLAWATPPEPPPGRGLTVVRRLRSGALALVRLRRG